MAPLGAEAVRAHLSGINDSRLTTTARTLRLGRFQTEIQRGRVRLQGVITNQHLLKALDTGRTSPARELSLQRLLQNPTLVLNEIEIDTIKALTLPVAGEESISQMAAAIISRISPPPSFFADDAFTVRHAPPPLAPPPRRDDLEDLQELQALEARRPEIKEKVGKVIKAIELLLPYERWSPSVEQVIVGLGGQLKADVALADRAAVLYKKLNAAAPIDLTGKGHFELPETLIVAGHGELLPSTRVTETELAAARGRIREIAISFNEMKCVVEAYALQLAEGKVSGINVDEEINSTDLFLKSLQRLVNYLEGDPKFFTKPENKFKLKGTTNLTIAAKFAALQDLIFEVGSKFGEAEEKNREQIGAVLGANNRLVKMIEKLKAFSDLTGQTIIEELDKLALETKTRTLGLLNKTNEDNKNAVDAVKAALCVKVQLRPQVQPPQPVPPPVPPEVLKFRSEFAALMREMKILFPALSIEAQDVLEKAPSDEEIAEIETIIPTREEAIEGADVALENRNRLNARALSAEAAGLFKKIQRCMEKYLEKKFGLFVIEPTIGTQYARVQSLVDADPRQETGKSGEILRVESLGFTDRDNKVIKKAKVIIGDGTVFTDKAFDTTGPDRPDSWSRVPPPALAAPSPGAAPATLPSSPPTPVIPRPSLGERIRGIGQRVRKGWRRVDRAMYRFQNRVVKTVIAAAKKINAQVVRLGRWEIRLQKSIKEHLLYQNVINIDVFYAKKWISSESRKIERFRKNGLVIRFAPEGNSLAEIYKDGSRYFLKITGNQDVWINGGQVTDWQQVNHGDTILVGDHSLVVDILPLRRSFERGKGVEWIAGGENGEIVLEQGALATHRAGRLHNQDAVGHAWLNEDEELFVLGDGMGGEAAGEIASLLEIQTIITEMKKGLNLEKAIERASQVIYEESQKNSVREGMGTTVVAALINHKTNRLKIAWVGDSRGKYIPQDASQEAGLLTRDHALLWTIQAAGIESLAEKLPITDSTVEQIEKNEMASGGRSSQITQVVGHPNKLKVHVVEMPFLPGPPVNTFLLYSDGLTGGLTERWITELVRQGGSPIAIAKRLLDAALKLGTRDNVSVAVIPMPALDLSQPVREEIFENNK